MKKNELGTIYKALSEQFNKYEALSLSIKSVTAPDKTAALEQQMDIVIQAINNLLDKLNKLSEINIVKKERNQMEKNKELSVVEYSNEIIKKLDSSSDTKMAWVNDSPVVKKMMRTKEEANEKKIVSLSQKIDNLFTIENGYLEPYDIAILEEIGKFKLLEKQVTPKGKTFCTLGQLYRALRGGGNRRPTKPQREDLLNDLEELASLDRRFKFSMTQAVKIWGGFEADSGKLRILSFDQYNGKIRGQRDTLIIFDDTIILHSLAENLRMYEVIPQEIKAIKEQVYCLQLSNGEVISGNGRVIQSKLHQMAMTQDNIVNVEEKYYDMRLSKIRIAIRTTLLKFIISYCRARALLTTDDGKVIKTPQPCSNKLPYATIYKNCNINIASRETVKRTKKDISIMLDHFQREGLINRWEEYTNKYDKDANGIKIYASTVAKE